MDLSKKAFLITGASGGLGKLVSKELADAGASLLLTCRNREKLEDVVRVDRSRINIFEYDSKKDNLIQFFAWLTTYLNSFNSSGFEYGLFNALGTPARTQDLNQGEIEQVKEDSFLINYKIPREITEYFIRYVGSAKANILFMSSQHTYTKTPGKEAYYTPKKKLETYAFGLNFGHPNLIVNTILAGNLGIGMSSGTRELYEKDKTLVDQDVIVNLCLNLLTTKNVNGKRILVKAENGGTKVKTLL